MNKFNKILRRVDPGVRDLNNKNSHYTYVELSNKKFNKNCMSKSNTK